MVKPDKNKGESPKKSGNGKTNTWGGQEVTNGCNDGRTKTGSKS